MCREQGIVQQTDLNNGSGIPIVFSGLEGIKTSAKITQGTLYPVMLVDHLEFQIDDGEIIQMDFDIQNKGFVREGGAQFDGIGDLCGGDFFCGKVQKRADQAL